jgi:AGCS family alanine or glycine:cation symporter
MKAFLDAILAFTNWVWGIPMLILLVGGGFFLAVRLDLIPYKKLPFILKNTIGKSFRKDPEADGKFSAWQAASGALASTLGAGNIVGTAMAIAFGGPGGVFWLWIAGLAACAVKYTEVTTAMLHRELDKRGNWVGGPQYYLGSATGWKWTGQLYTVLCLFALFLAASAQIGSGVDNLVALGADRTVSAAILTLLCIAVVVGGMKNLLAVSEKVVPFMSVLYVGGALVVILLNIENLPRAFFSIFRYAFTGRAAVGGFAGATLAACIRWGICRGVYSNDAGTGYTTMVHTVASVNHPVQQGMWGVFEAFFDTLVVCNLTCFAILCTDTWTVPGVTSATMTAVAFSSTIGKVGSWIVSIALLLFTFTTACAQIEFSCVSLVKMIGEKGRTYGRWVLLFMTFVGGMVGIETMINYVDFGTALMTIINMVCVLLCHNQVVKVTKEYFADPLKWEHQKWPKWEAMERAFRQEKVSAK